MENEEQPAAELSKEERIEAHFTTPDDYWNKYTFGIYTSVTESGLFDDAEVPLDAFTYADGFIHLNRDKPLSVVRACMNYFDEQEPPFTNEQKRFILDQLIRYYNTTVFDGPDKKEYSLERVKKLLQQEKDKLDEPDMDNVKRYDWQTTKQYLDTLPDTTDRIKHLIERRAEYKQNFDELPEWGASYADHCQTEIKKLKELVALEQQGQTTKTPFKLSDKTGAKTNLIRILNALYELNLIELENGQRPTKEQFMQQIGGYLGVDMKRYEQALSAALEQPLETNLRVFEQLKNASQAQVLARQENGRK